MSFNNKTNLHEYTENEQQVLISAISMAMALTETSLERTKEQPEKAIFTDDFVRTQHNLFESAWEVIRSKPTLTVSEPEKEEVE